MESARDVGGRRQGNPRAGFTLIEVMAAVMVLAIAVLGASSAILSSAGLTRLNRDTDRARQALRQELERLQGLPLAEVFAAHNDETDDDAALSIAAPGPGFEVVGLTPVADDEDGLCGRITFPVAASDPGALRENLDDPELGLPFDLNLDGAIDAADHSEDYRLLPVRVEVRWLGVAGERSTEIVTVLTQP